MLNTFCPSRGSNWKILRGNQTLYRIAIKAGLYPKAVQVCIIPNIKTAYSPSISDSSPNLNKAFHKSTFDTDVSRAIGWVILRWAPNITGKKMLNTFCPGRGWNRDLLHGSQKLYRIAFKACLYRKAVQVCIIPNITTQKSGVLIAWLITCHEKT